MSQLGEEFNEPPLAGDDVETALGQLERQRRTFAWKTGGLDAAGLSAKVGSSSMTLGRLVKHLAMVEEDYFRCRLHGREPGPPWNAVDWENDPEWPWHSADGDSPDELYALYRNAVAQSRALLEEALADGKGLDRPIALEFDGETISLRWLMANLIEEYARHVGHADLIREAVDGLVGEDPPD
jgi:hypothetical protein